MKLRENQIITVTGIDYTFDGLGVAKYADETIFVTNLIIGEVAEVKISAVKRNFALGKIKQILKISPDRIKPLSKVATASGVTCFEHLSYAKELEYKVSKVERSFRTIAHMDVKVKEIMGMDNPYFYRNKVVMPIGLDKSGHIIHGYYRAKSHEIVPMQDNSIENKITLPILNTIKKLMNDFAYIPYNESDQSGDIRKVMIRTSHYYPQVMVVLITNKRTLVNFNNFVNALVNLHPQITTIVQNINTRDSNVILGDEEIVHFGPGFILDKLCGLDFKISSKSFYQINVVQTEKLYTCALEYAQLGKNDVILDAYCGIGTISLIAASKVKHAYGVEIVKEAVNDAKENAKRNNISNVSYTTDDASSYINNLVRDNKEIDVVIVDPPRKGLDEKFIHSVKKLAPRSVIYISCDPGTLARDIKLFSDDYDLIEITAVDMFPRTYHVENIVSLYRR